MSDKSQSKGKTKSDSVSATLVGGTKVTGNQATIDKLTESGKIGAPEAETKAKS